MKAAPVASSLGLVSVPSDVVREGQVAGNMVTAKGGASSSVHHFVAGLLRIPFAPSIGRTLG